MVESMVSVLLLLTILYCVRLNKQLRLLKADEQTLRATIAELITATEIAERAIGGLEIDRCAKASRAWAERSQRVEACPSISSVSSPPARSCWRVSIRIIGAARPANDRAGFPDAKSVAAAAQAFAERDAREARAASRHDPLPRDFRLIPVVLLATICLFALKVSGLVFDGGYTLAERLQAAASLPI